MPYYQRRGGFFANLPVVTKNILIINVLLWIITELRPDFMTRAFALFYPASPFFHWWQPITHMFMHGGFGHLFVNMFTFLMFGCALERQWGAKKYLTFYFITGLGAAALHLCVMALQLKMGWVPAGQLYSIPMVGASGAIYGVLMGYAMLFPDTELTLIFPPITLSAKWWIIIWIAIELLTGIFSIGGGIAHFAHLGGMLFGYILIKYWKRKGTMYQYED